MATINQISVDGTVYDLPGSGTNAMLDTILSSREIVWSDDASAWQYRGHNIFTPDDEKAVKEEGYSNALIFYSQMFKSIVELENGYNGFRKSPFLVIPEPINIPLNTEPLVSIADMCESAQNVKIIYIGNLYISSGYEAFYGCSQLEAIDGNIFVNRITDADLLADMFGGCDSLKSFDLFGLSCDLNLANCTQMTQETLNNLIDRAIAQTDGFTIILPDGYAVSDSTLAASTAKNITLSY